MLLCVYVCSFWLCVLFLHLFVLVCVFLRVPLFAFVLRVSCVCVFVRVCVCSSLWLCSRVVFLCSHAVLVFVWRIYM